MGSITGMTWLEADAKSTAASAATLPQSGANGGVAAAVSHLLEIETEQERQVVHDLIARCKI